MTPENEKEAVSAAGIIAWGIAIMLVLLGFGGCCALGDSHVVLEITQPAPAHK